MEKEPPIAVKTHTYLDILRERKKIAPKVTKSSTTTVTTTTTSTSTTTSTTTTTTTITTTVTKESKDHPTSHLRPQQEPRIPSTTQKAGENMIKPVVCTTDNKSFSKKCSIST